MNVHVGNLAVSTKELFGIASVPYGGQLTQAQWDSIRRGNWEVTPAPAGVAYRIKRMELTEPTDSMCIHLTGPLPVGVRLALSWPGGSVDLLVEKKPTGWEANVWIGHWCKPTGPYNLSIVGAQADAISNIGMLPGPPPAYAGTPHTHCDVWIELCDDGEPPPPPPPPPPNPNVAEALESLQYAKQSLQDASEAVEDAIAALQ